MTKATNPRTRPTSAEPKPAADPEPFLTIEDVATRLRVDVVTVRRWIKDGHVRAIKLPKGYRIAPADLAHFLGDRVVATPQARP